MDFSLSAEKEDLRHRIGDFCRRWCSEEKEQEMERQGEFPHEFYNALVQEGFMRLPVERRYGGDGGDMVDLAIVIEELTKYSRGGSFAYGTTGVFGAKMIGLNGSEEQKQAYLPSITRGDLKFAFALTEPEAGSDAASVRTTATTDAAGDIFYLNGSKVFISAAATADYLMTVARTDATVPKHRGLTIFFVQRSAAGLTVRPLKKLGGKAVGAYEIFYEDVVVDRQHILGGEAGLNRGWEGILKCLNTERVTMAAVGLGAAEASLAEALRGLHQKEVVEQAEQHRLAEIATDIEAARCLTYYAAWKMSQGLPCSQEASMAKLFATELEKRAAVVGLDICGWSGQLSTSAMQRHFRDSLLATIGGGTSQIQKNIIAGALGL